MIGQAFRIYVYTIQGTINRSRLPFLKKREIY